MPGALTPPQKKAQAVSGYSLAAKTVLQEGASRVQEVHSAIAGKSFELLKRVPLVGGPAQLVQHAHDAISGGIYGAIRHLGGGLLDLAGAVEKQRAVEAPQEPQSQLARSIRSALNAAFGDHLAETNSVLAIQMGIFLNGRAIPVERAALARAYPDAGERLSLFIHGLGFDEQCWAGDQDALNMPRQLAIDYGTTALTLRYNTGLPIAENGQQLAALLEELLAAWPDTVSELLIIGHSMGGLLARSACTQASAAGLAWPVKTRMVICLGSPHLGAPLEKLGQFATQALRLSNITAPLSRIAERRSRGIQDLRDGPGTHQPTGDKIAWRFIGGSLTEDPDNPLGKLVGDGLVTVGSATAHELTGDVQSVRLGKVSHMGLIGDVRVYAQIRQWLKHGTNLVSAGTPNDN